MVTSIVNSAESGAVVEESLKELTYVQKERCNAIHHIYGDDSEEIVRLVSGRSNLSWSITLSNILKIFSAKHEEADYYRAIKQTFELDGSYNETSISQEICGVRAELGLPPYEKRISAQCLDDFLTVFMAENVRGADKKKTKIHKILYSLVK